MYFFSKAVTYAHGGLVSTQRDNASSTKACTSNLHGLYGKARASVLLELRAHRNSILPEDISQAVWVGVEQKALVGVDDELQYVCIERQNWLVLVKNPA